MKWYFGAVLPAATCSLTSTSMTSPFSAWTHTRAPHSLPFFSVLQERRVVDHDGALVGHEELEAGHAFVDQHGYLGERVGVEVGDGHVQSVVHRDVAVGHRPPVGVGLHQRVAGGLHGEVHDHGRAAARGRLGAGIEPSRS